MAYVKYKTKLNTTITCKILTKESWWALNYEINLWTLNNWNLEKLKQKIKIYMVHSSVKE